MTKKVRIIILSVLVASAAVFLAVAATGNSKGEATQAAQAETNPNMDVTFDITGTWANENMFATVTDSTIVILWSTKDLNGLYWKGSFTATVANGEKIFSAGDTVAMEESMLASQDSDKEFVYENNTLSFKRTVAGVTQIIRMTRAAPS